MALTFGKCLFNNCSNFGGNMNEMDVLRKISDNLVERKSSAALNNYQVLTNNIEYLNNLYSQTFIKYSEIYQSLINEIKIGIHLNQNFQDDTKQEFYLKRIISAILNNDINILGKFLECTKPDCRDDVKIDTVYQLSKGFNDYNELVTTSRQFIDSLVADIYQILIWDAKELNYHILKSLSSFRKYATESLVHSIFNEETQEILDKFNLLSKNKKLGKKSDFTKCDNKSFKDKLDYIYEKLELKDDIDEHFKSEIINLYGFSSEFTHVGYISTFFASSTNKNEVIFGDDIGPYLLSSENFNELKYRILNSGMIFLSSIYFPALIKCFSNVFIENSFNTLEKDIKKLIEDIDKGLATRYQTHYAFIVSDYKLSGKEYPFQCVCGHNNILKPPYRSSDQYCRKCGSSITLIAVEEKHGYIVTNNGLARVIGSNAPILTEEEEYKYFEEILKQHPKSS